MLPGSLHKLRPRRLKTDMDYAVGIKKQTHTSPWKLTWTTLWGKRRLETNMNYAVGEKVALRRPEPKKDYVVGVHIPLIFILTLQ